MKRRILFYGGVFLALVLPIAYMTLMPGSGHRGPLPEASPETRALAIALETHVVALAQTIGERRVGHGDSLERSRAYIESVARRSSNRDIRRCASRTSVQKARTRRT